MITSARRRSRLAVMLAGLLFAVGLSVSCGSSDSGSTDAPVIDVQLGRYTIIPPLLVVPVGEVVLRVTNVDEGMVHNLVAASRGTSNLAPGETQLLPIDVEAGEYRMWCDIPGHVQMGQTGVLRSEEPGPTVPPIVTA